MIQREKRSRIIRIMMMCCAFFMLYASSTAAEPAHKIPEKPMYVPAETAPAERVVPPETDIVICQTIEPGQAAGIQYNAGASRPAIQCTSITGAYIQQTTTWYFQASGGTAPYRYTYELVERVMKNGQPEYYLQTRAANVTSGVFQYQFIFNGTYELWATVTDAKGQTATANVAADVSLAGYDRLVLNIRGPSTYNVNQTVTWQAAVTGGDGNYAYHFDLISLEPAIEEYDIVTGKEGMQPSNVFSYTLLANGKYRLVTIVKDGKGWQETVYTDFTVNTAGGMTVAEKARQVLDEAWNAGKRTDYELALYAHEWLIRHADYDYDLPTHFGADGALLGGKAVCSGYSKAFDLMMTIAGIPCDIISSTSMSHAWNAVKLGGNWYMVDTTWDDGSAGCGFNHHWYCFVPKAVLDTDHGGYTSSRSCTKLDANYYVVENIARGWLDKVAYAVWEKLQDGSYRFSVPFADYFEAEGRTYMIEDSAYTNQVNPTKSIQMNKLYDMVIRQYIVTTRDYYYRDYTVPLILKTYSNERKVYVTMDFEGKTLVLPEGLTTIEGEAFKNDLSIMAVIIPESVTMIKGRAFENCSNLWKIVLKNPDTHITHAAFPTDTGHLCIISPENSTGYEYACDNRLLWARTE